MNEPTEQDDRELVIHVKSKVVRMIRRKADGSFGLWSRQRGWVSSKIRWENWRLINREPLTEAREFYR